MNVSCFRDDVESPRHHTSPTIENINKTPEPQEKTPSPIDIPTKDDKTDEGVNLSIAESPKHQPTAFVINFDDGKTVDTSRFENLLKKSQARHQRVQSMSASWQRPLPPNGHQQRPPMSAKLPRKAHGYHSEGYFSSDQEDSFVGSSKLRHNQIPHETNKKQLHNNNTGGNFTPVSNERESFRNRHLIKSDNTFSPASEKRNIFDKSPDSYYAQQKKSKSPVIDNIMTRSDILPSRQGLILPLKHPYTTATLGRTNSDMISSPNSATRNIQNYIINSPYLIEQSPNEIPMLADMSSPELDMLTPDNILQTPGTPVRLSPRRNSSGPLRSFSPSAKNNLKSPGMSLQQMVRSPSLNRKFNNEPAAGEAGNVSPSSTVSEAGTYTIEADHYTEEQKAKMNIDEIFGTDDFKEPLRQALNKMHKTSPKKETNDSFVITTEPRLANFSSNIREELLLAKTIPDPVRKVSTDKNVLEISCCYESPTESNEPPQMTKPTKSAKSYLDKIKSRVKNISEKTFQKTPKTPEASVDVGSFTSVTASGVLGSTLTISQRTPKNEDMNVRERLTRKNSLTKSQIDSSEYVHKMSNSNLVFQNVSNESFVPAQKCKNMSEGCYIKSPAGLSKSLIVDDIAGRSQEQTEEQILVGRLSNISLNRCQGDKSWIREWADSVKKHNKEMGGEPDIAITGLPPVSPRHSAVIKGISSPSSACSSPSKIPSPVGTMVRQRAPIPDILSSTPDTESYLLNTQNVISSLQAKLQQATYNSSSALPDKSLVPSKLPVSQLSRSNSLNYRLHKRTNPSSAESSPLRNPGRYLITGNNHLVSGARPLLSHTGASKSLDTDPRILNWKEELRNQKNSDNNDDFDWEKYKNTVLLANLRITEPLHVKENISRVQDSDDKKSHSRHKSFDGRSARDFFNNILQERDSNNIMTRSLNANVVTEGVVYAVANVRGPIDQSRGNIYSAPSNQRVSGLRNANRKSSSGNVSPQGKVPDKTHIRRSSAAANGPMNSPIRRSSSFNVVNKGNNNNNYDNAHSGSKNILGSPVAARVDSGLRSSDRRGRPDGRMQRSCELSIRNNTPEVDYMSEDSDNLSTGGFYSDYDRRSMRRSDGSDILAGTRYNRAFALRRARIASPDLRAQHSGGGSSGSPRCPGTPEMRRKFANEDVRTRTRDSRSVTRKGDNIGPCATDKDVAGSAVKALKSRKMSEGGRPSGQVTSRMTRSSSTNKEFQPKVGERNVKKPNAQVMAAQAKDLEFTNWKKRASYDPMKAAQEGKKRNPNANIVAASAQVVKNVRRSDADEVVSPSHSSPVHRSRSFNCTGGLTLSVSVIQTDQSEAGRGSPDTDDFEDRLVCTMPAEGNQPVLKIVSGVDVDVSQVVRRSRKSPQSNNITLANDYVPKFQVNQQAEVLSPRSRLLDAEKRKTHLIENSELLHLDVSAERRHPIPIPNHHLLLDSDTGNSNSTTNGSGGSRRNSSNYSDQENTGQVGEERLSDSEDVESDNDRRNKDSGVVVVMRGKSRSVPPQQRHSGDFSMSSSTTSASKDLASGVRKTSIQPRYLDISKYKTNEPSPAKNFLRRDPSKTYVGVLPSVEHRQQAKRNTAKQEQELKNKELEKWKRRASYDPRKAAAQAKQRPSNAKSPSSSVLRSQSFHGPMTHTTKMSISTSDKHNADQFYADALSDNEF